MYQEAIKYALKAWSLSALLVATYLLFINFNNKHFDMLTMIFVYRNLAIYTSVGFVLIVLWFRFKFHGEVFIKRLLTGVLGTFLGIALYIYFSITIDQSILVIFLIGMIGGVWYFELPMEKKKVDRSEEADDILDA